MRCFARATCVGFALLGYGCAAPPPPPVVAQGPIAPTVQLPTPVEVLNVHPSPDRPGTAVGEWSADLKDRLSRAPVQVTVTWQQEKSTQTNTYWRSDTPIDGLPAVNVTGTVHFGLARPAGALTFDGTSDGKKAAGVVRYEPDATYAADIQRMYGTASSERLFELAVCGYDLSYAHALFDAGYRFTLPEVLALYLSATPSDYCIELRKAGYDFSFGDILHLHNAGILTGFSAEVRQGGYQLSAEDLILLAHSGVPADYAVAMRRAGVAGGVSDLLYLQHSDVSADYARQFATAGYHFNAVDMVKIRQASIGGEYAISLKKAGYSLNAEELVRLNKASVDADYASALILGGHENLSVDEIIQLRQKGVDPEMIRKLRK